MFIYIFAFFLNSKGDFVIKLIWFGSLSLNCLEEIWFGDYDKPENLGDYVAGIFPSKFKLDFVLNFCFNTPSARYFD